MQSNQVNKWVLPTGDTQNLLYSSFDNQYGWSRSFFFCFFNIHILRYSVLSMRVVFIPLRRLIVLCRFQLNLDPNILLVAYSFLSLLKAISEIVTNVSHEMSTSISLFAIQLTLSFSLIHSLIPFRYKINISILNSDLTLCSNETDSVKMTRVGSERTIHWDKNDPKWPYVDNNVVYRQSNYTDRI